MDLIEFSKAFFRNTKAYVELTDKQKKSIEYMFTARLAIGHPQLIDKYHRAAGPYMLDFYRSILFTGRTPQFAYTKSVKSQAKKASVYKQYSNEELQLFAKLQSIDISSIEDFFKFYPDKAHLDMKIIKKSLETKAAKKRRSRIKQT